MSYHALPASDDALRSLEIEESSSSGHRQPRHSISSSRDSTRSPSPTPPSQRKHRSSTLSSLDFSFTPTVSLSLSGAEEEGHHNLHESKHVGLWNGIALVVGMQIGSGIFSSPGIIADNVGSEGGSLVIWVISGVLAWTGAASFAELGSAIPINGGAQAYLAYAYGPLPSYLFTFTAISLLKPGSAAIIALIFGEYVNRLIHQLITHPDISSTGTADSPAAWTYKLTAVIAVIMVAVLNVVNRKLGTSLSVVLTMIKVASLMLLLSLALFALIKHHGVSEMSGLKSWSEMWSGTSGNVGRWGIGLYSGLWAMDGWDQSNYVAGEMSNVTRDLPRVIHGSMGIVTTLFTLANVAYFVVLSRSVVESSNTVALDFGRMVIGPAGSIVFSVLVSISCFGALLGGFYTSSRLVYAAAKEKFLPNMFGQLSRSRGTPLNAMILQTVLTVLFVVFGGGFRTLVNFFSVANWLFYFLTVLGLLILRAKEPYLERPYRCWLITPVTFCAVALFLLTMPIVAAPLEALAAFGFITLGVPIFYITAASREEGGGKIWESGQAAGPSAANFLSRIRSVFPSVRMMSFSGAGRGERDEMEERVEMLSQGR